MNKSLNEHPIEPELLDAFEQLLGQIHGAPAGISITAIEESLNGAQGYSGSQVRYFTVTCHDSNGVTHQDSLVSKAASLLERRVLHRLSGQGCAVPPVVISDVTSEERRLVYMPFLESRPALESGHYESAITRSMADGLAGIHAANLAAPPDWLPHVSDNYLDRLWLHGWREQWETNLGSPEFASEFGAYTSRLDESMEHFMDALHALTAEGTSLTLLSVDLIPDHIRMWRDEVRFIDWEQAAYGSLYLDLANPFGTESALLYRDALARHGHSIPVPEFLERFHEIGRYMGLRYLGFALWQWAQGGAERERGRWFLYYTFHLALHGR